MNRRSIREIGIRTRILFLALFPLLLVSTLLGYYMIQTRIQDTEDHLRNHASELSQHLAPLCEFGLFSRNTALLTNLAHAALHDPNVYSVTIMNDATEILARAVAPVPQNTAVEAAQATLIHTAPVLATGIAATDLEAAATDGPLASATDTGRLIGWVEVRISRIPTLERQRQIIRNGIMIILIGILFSAFLAVAIGESVTEPILRLKAAVAGLGKGTRAARVAADSGGEIGALEAGFNAMAAALEAEREIQDRRIAEATEVLSLTIRELRTKNEELDKAHARATRAGEEKANFLANMSHEIRTPLNAIAGYAGLLKNTPLSHEQADYARIITRASAQLLCVIDDILNFSKLASGTVALEEVPFNLRDAFEDVAAMLSPAALAKDLELTLFIHSDVPVLLYGDPNRLNQVLINLVNNAIKFTDSGRVDVQVKRGWEKDDQVEIQVSVTDTGIGLNQEAQRKIFTSFQQADATVTRRYGGTGLGLAIVARIVDLMHGKIDVESAEGSGSTFRFRVPFRRQSDQDTGAPGVLLSGLKVLLCEPNPLARRGIRNFLLSWNAQVYICNEQEHLRRMLEIAADDGDPYGLVIVSLSPEQARSDEAKVRMTALRSVYQGPIVCLTSTDVGDAAHRLSADPSVLFLAKPVRRHTLLRRICELLGCPTQPTAPRHAAQGPPPFAHLQILVAEDNEFSRTLITKILRSRDIAVSEAADGAQALALAGSGTFDMIFLDMHLPKCDGLTVARRIRAAEAPGRRVPIVALTADVFINDEGALTDAGVDACLYKPLDPDKLWALIGELAPGSPHAYPSHDDAPDTAPGAHFPAELVAKLARDLPAYVRRLEQALAARDLVELAERVHEIKGVAGYFKLSAIYAMAEELENTLRAGDNLDGFAAALRRVDDEVQKLARGHGAEGPGGED